MRFLAARSMTEGRKTILFNTLLLMPISMLVVSNAGWIGNAMTSLGFIKPDADPNEAFVIVTEMVCKPGVFGFVLAALTAALMSTIDTLTNACAAIFVYDVYQPYLARQRSDRHYLRVARLVSVGASALGLGCAFIFSQFHSIYEAHGAFTAAVTPPIVVSVALGAFWKRYTPAAAFWSMFGGAALIWLSVKYPVMIEPFAGWLHGMDPQGGYKYMRAFFGLLASGAIGVVISMFTTPKPESEIAGLWIGSIDWGRRFFKGGAPSFEIGKKVVSSLAVSGEGTGPWTAPAELMADAPPGQPAAEYHLVRLNPEAMQRLKAGPGDLLYVADARRYLGGLRSLHARAGETHDGAAMLISQDAFNEGNFVPGRAVRIEKIF
jgi:SSS family solute:Na+ symporter